MITQPRKSWRCMTQAQRRKRLEQILTALERRRLIEPIPRTTGEWQRSAGYLQAATRFCYCIVGCR